MKTLPIDAKRKTTNDDIGGMYLVIQRRTMDDIPILLTPDCAIAEGAAATIPMDGPRVRDATKALGIDDTTPVCTAVIHFCADGTPCGMKIIHSYTDDEQEAYEKSMAPMSSGEKREHPTNPAIS